MDRKVARHLYYSSGYKDISGVDGLEARLTAIELDNSVATVTNLTAATYTVLGTEELIVSNRGSAIAAALPIAATALIGFGFLVKNVGVGAITFTPNGSETIDGGATLVLAQNQAAHIVCTAAGVWRSVNTDIPARVEAAITAADIQGDVDAAIVTADIPGAVDDYLGAEPALLLAAMNGDIVMEISPANTFVTVAAAADGFSEPVTFTFKTAAGDVHTWINGTGSASVSDDGAGDSSLSDTTPAVVNGVGTFNVIGTTASWLEGQIATAVIANYVVAGKTVTGGNALVTISA